MTETLPHGRAGRNLHMKCPRRNLTTAIAGAGLGLLALDGHADAADIPPKTPAMATVFDWTGLYIGAHTGFGRGASRAVLSDPAPSTAPSVFDGLIGGVQAGYNYRSTSGVLVGVEADISFPNYFTSNKIVSSLTSANSAVVEAWDHVGTVRGRLGYAAGPSLFYLTGGLAWASERFTNAPAAGSEEKILNTRLGWAAGAGLEYGFAPDWSVKLEYLYSRFDDANIRFASGAQYSSTLDFQSLRIGLNRKIDWPGQSDLKPGPS